MLAIAVHSSLDGTVYAVTAAIDPFTAISTATGLILHEMPETLICFLLLQRGGFTDRSATLLAFLAAGATTLVSAIISGPFALSVDPSLLGACSPWLLACCYRWAPLTFWVKPFRPAGCVVWARSSPEPRSPP